MKELMTAINKKAKEGALSKEYLESIASKEIDALIQAQEGTFFHLLSANVMDGYFNGQHPPYFGFDPLNPIPYLTAVLEKMPIEVERTTGKLEAFLNWLNAKKAKADEPLKIKAYILIFNFMMANCSTIDEDFFDSCLENYVSIVLSHKDQKNFITLFDEPDNKTMLGLDWAVIHSSISIPIHSSSQETKKRLLLIAAKAGDQAHVRIILSALEEDLASEQAALNIVIENHSLKVLNTALEKLAKDKSPIIKLTLKVLYAAITAGKLEVVKYCLESKKEYFTPHEVTEAFLKACKSGQTSIIEYLIPSLNNNNAIEKGFSVARKNHQFETIIDLFKATKEETLKNKFRQDFFYSVAQAGSLDDLKKALEISPSQESINEAFIGLGLKAETEEHLEKFKYLCTLQGDHKPNQEAVNRLMSAFQEKMSRDHTLSPYALLTLEALFLMNEPKASRQEPYFQWSFLFQKWMYTVAHSKKWDNGKQVWDQTAPKIKRLQALLGIRIEIDKLTKYGEEIGGYSSCPKKDREIVMDTTKALGKIARDWFFTELNNIVYMIPSCTPPTKEELEALSQKTEAKVERLQQEFSETLKKGYQSMNKHREIWRPALKILGNIMIALTGIGAPFLIFQLYKTGHGFFSTFGETIRQKRILDIETLAKNIRNC